jgi:chitinase
MTRRRRGILVLMTLGAVVAALVLAPTTHAAGTLTATFSKDSDWDTGYQGKYTILNGTTATVSTWTVAFTLPAGQTLGTFWDADLTTAAGNRVTAVSRSYNATLAPNASATFGFVVSYSGNGSPPTACTVNGQACGGGTATTAPPTTAPATTAPPTTAPPTTAPPTTRPPTTTAPPSSAPTTTIGAPPTTSPPPAAGFNRVGYFVQWGIYGRAYFPRNLVTTQAANRLTHINYAFENIDPVNLTCLNGVTKATTANPQDPNQGHGAGDAEADYQRTYSAGNSVDGSTDTFNQPLAGNFNQFRQLKAQSPNLKVLVSLGGWTYSKYFSDVALTAASRQKFVSSCIDMYLRGNLPLMAGRGGPGAAAGIFDGFDIDWEWPGADGHPGNHVRAADKQNFTLLLQEFHNQLNAFGAQTGKRYLLSAFLPADPAKIAAGFDLTQIFSSLDFGNMQGYDFHGSGSDNSWEPNRTGHQANLNIDVDDPSTVNFSVNDSINLYLNAGVSPRKLTMGLPFYGRGWQGVTDGGKHGEWQAAGGAAPGQFPEEASIRGYTNLVASVPGMTVFHDTQAVATFGYTGAGGQWWTFDDAWSLGQKTAYVRARNLLGVMIWEMSGDDGTLLSAVDLGLL